MLLVLVPLASLSLAGQEHGRTIPLAVIAGIEIPQRSSLLPPPRCAFVWGGGTGAGFSSVSPRFRTIQVGPKDFPAMPRQSEGAAPATFVGGLTMSERVVDEGQSWASDIIGVVSGVGLYSVLIFSCNLPVPIRSGLKPATDYGWEGYALHATARVHHAARRRGGGDGRSRRARSSRPYRLLASSVVDPPAPQATLWLHSARA